MALFFITNKMPPLIPEETQRAGIQSKSKRMLGRTAAFRGVVGPRAPLLLQGACAASTVMVTFSQDSGKG